MDISDILEDLNAQHLQQDPFAEDDSQANKQHPGQADLQALTRAWINERGTTELLPWPPNNLIERTTTAIATQIAHIETLTSTSNFTLIILQTELERTKYLLRSLLRTRLSKIDTHALYYLNTPSLRSRMSEMEVQYAERHQELLMGHYMGSFLGGFPAGLRGLDDTAGGVNMVGGPDGDGGVFVRGVGGGCVVEGRGREGDGEVSVGRGEVVVARWGDIREGVERGELELV